MEAIPVNTPLLNGNERQYLNECIDTGWISSEGPFVKRFEKEFSSSCQRKFGIAVSNGSAALDVAFRALDLPKGSEVILPTFTIISCIQAILNNGLTPVLVDSDPDTWNMDISKVQEKITSNTAAILAVHLYGLALDMQKLESICKEKNLKLVEDTAEAIGQTSNGTICGSFGDISTFSFYPNKHITTGEGGMVVTNDPHLAIRSDEIKNLCFKANPRFVHEELGWNYRMTNLQAAIGVAQLEQLGTHLDIKRNIGMTYNSGIFSNPNYQKPLLSNDNSENLFWVYGIQLHGKLQGKRDQICSALADKKIGSRPFFWCMHEQPVFSELFENESYPVAEAMARDGFYLPSGLALSKENQTRVINDFNEIIEGLV